MSLSKVIIWWLAGIFRSNLIFVLHAAYTFTVLYPAGNSNVDTFDKSIKVKTKSIMSNWLFYLNYHNQSIK